MTIIQVTAERVVHAPPKKVFALLYDYELTRASLYPKAFADFRVLDHGQGGRTHFGYTLPLAGSQRHVEAEVTVTKRKREIVETDLQRGTTTTFTIVPDGPDCRVQIEVNWETQVGLAGAIERRIAPRQLRALCEDLLNSIAFWAPNWYELPRDIADAARLLDGDVYLYIPAKPKRKPRGKRSKH